MIECWDVLAGGLELEFKVKKLKLEASVCPTNWVPNTILVLLEVALYAQRDSDEM